MTLKILAAALFLAQAGPAAQPLPVLHTEPIPGGSIFRVKNTGTQPVTAFLIELVNYPGSYYSLWQDEAAGDLIAPGAEKRIQVTNMTVGAVPDYVKLQAALFADGSAAGIPEKIAQMVERRRFILATIRELIARIEKAQAASTPPADLIAALQQWAQSLQPARRADPTAQATINNAAARDAISKTVASLESGSPAETLAHLRAHEKSLAAAKPLL